MNLVSIILATRSDKHLPWQTPDMQNFPTHSALVPHLHVPDSQLSDVDLEHIGLTPHIQISEIHVSDNPVQS